MKEWIYKSPRLDEIAGEIKDTRDKRSKVAIIIPTYRDKSRILAHLKKLKNQTFQGFDLIIVYGKEDTFLDVPAIHIRENGDYGCAGAYYMGEKKAISENYETIILADDDAHPVSEDLIERLVEAVNTGAELSYPRVSYPPCLKSCNDRIIHHYGCMSAKVLRKSGLTFFPFATGGEDIELQERFKNENHKMADVDAEAEHPKRPPLQIEEGSKLHHYQRGHLLSHLIRGRYYGAWRFIIFNSMMGIGFLLLGRKLGLRFLSAVWSGSGMVLFKETPGIILPPEPKDIGPGYMEISIGSKIPVPYDYLEGNISLGRRVGWFTTYLKNLPKFFNKKVLLIDRNRITPDIPIMLVSRKSATRYKGTDCLISDEASLPVVVLRSAAFALSLPTVMALSLLLVCRGIILKRIKKIRTLGYGIKF